MNNVLRDTAFVLRDTKNIALGTPVLPFGKPIMLWIQIVFFNINKVHQEKTVILNKSSCDDGIVKQMLVMKNSVNDGGLMKAPPPGSVNVKRVVPIQMSSKRNCSSRSLIRQSVKAASRCRRRE